MERLFKYRYLLYDIDSCYENETNRLQAKKAIREEWRLRQLESLDLQEDLNQLEAPLPNFQAIQMWQTHNNQYDAMEQALLRIRIENNIMALRRARYGMMKRCYFCLKIDMASKKNIKEEQLKEVVDVVVASEDDLNNEVFVDAVNNPICWTKASINTIIDLQNVVAENKMLISKNAQFEKRISVLESEVCLLKKQLGEPLYMEVDNSNDKQKESVNLQDTPVIVQLPHVQPPPDRQLGKLYKSLFYFCTKSTRNVNPQEITSDGGGVLIIDYCLDGQLDLPALFVLHLPQFQKIPKFANGRNISSNTITTMC
ncbi:hypothetical protein Fmac_001460 [Flemingia macrophylla]|uniref:Uncharacterized protein n=1 Tax=Flemingia macrophylla TaxID=520843 RepID=A0ABD1NH59_9FABA